MLIHLGVEFYNYTYSLTPHKIKEKDSSRDLF